MAMDIFVDLSVIYCKVELHQWHRKTNLLLCKRDYLLYIMVATFNLLHTLV